MIDLPLLLSDALGLAPVQLQISTRPPLAHQSNRLYDVWAGAQHYIAKQFLKPEELTDAPAREFGALRLLAPLDIAPQPVFYEPARGPVVIYRYLDGAMWDRRRPSGAELGQLAELWLRQHALPTRGVWLSRNQARPVYESMARFRALFQQYADWAAASFQPARVPAQLCLETLDRRLEIGRRLSEAAPVLCFGRGDARFANIIGRPDGRLGLVDWEDAGLRDPARDVVDLLTHPNQEDLLSGAEWQAFLEPYLDGRRGLDPGLVERIHLYQAAYPLFWLSVVIRQELARPPGDAAAVNGLPPNERLRRYLARALAWPDHDFAPQLAALAGLEFFPEAHEPAR